MFAAKSPYDSSNVEDFITLMKNKHNYDENKLRKLFDEIVPEKKLLKFFIKAPERTLTWNGCSIKDMNCLNYKNLFVNDSLSNGGIVYWNENQKYLRKASLKFGVPPEIIIAIIGIESNIASLTKFS